MLKKLVWVLSLLVLALVLTACPEAGTNQNEPVWAGTIPANSETNQDVLLKSDLSGDLIYFELGEGVNAASLVSSGIGVVGNLKLYVKEQSGTTLFSDNPKYFTELDSNKLMESSGIVVEPNAKTECRGPCVIEEYSKISSNFKVNVKIRNDNNFAVKFKLFAFVAKSADKNEPNGSTQCVTKIHPTSALAITPKKNIVINGALEFLKDVDCFKVTEQVSSVELKTNIKNATGVKAVIWEIGGNHPLDSITLSPGSKTTSVSVGNKKIVVYVSTVNRAGPANSSSYTLTIK